MSEWLTKRELAAALKVSTRTIERLRLPCWEVGGQNRYDLEEVKAALRGAPQDGGNVVRLRPRPRGAAA